MCSLEREFEELAQRKFAAEARIDIDDNVKYQILNAIEEQIKALKLQSQYDKKVRDRIIANV